MRASSTTRSVIRSKQTAEVHAPAEFERDLVALGADKRAVRLDPAACPEAIARLVADNGGKILRGADPIAPMKAVKNAAEIAGARAAQLRDGVAVTRFLAWFDREAPSGKLTEIDAVEALESFRRDTGLLKDVSFPTIAGAGSDGAIVHYRVSRKSNRRIAPGELFLIDSGGQYEDGTTDITRTVAVGTPSEDARKNATLVLKGHIAIARAVFPDGTTGAQLDTLARQFLWRAGLDFDHGTGHGVGSYLSVHEGPARIAKLGAAPLKRGMIMSNEPGYYRAGAYGIRIENLVLVSEAEVVRRRRKAAQRLRDADAGAARPPADRARDAERRRNCLAQRLSRARARRADAARRCERARLAARRNSTACLCATLTGCGRRKAHARFAQARWALLSQRSNTIGSSYRMFGTFTRRRRFPLGLERSEENVMLGTILIIILILLLVGALPTWPYSTGWGYYPGGGLGLVLIIVVILVLVGRI